MRAVDGSVSRRTKSTAVMDATIAEAPAGNTTDGGPSRLGSGEHLRMRTLGDGGNGTAQDHLKRVEGQALPHSFRGSCPQFISE
jgi:hypothetical protein